MTKEEIKQKEDRLGEMYLAYYRMLVLLNDKSLELDKMRLDLSNLAKEIEENYIAFYNKQDTFHQAYLLSV